MADPREPVGADRMVDVDPATPPISTPPVSMPATRAARRRGASPGEARSLPGGLVAVRVLSVVALAGLFVLSAWAHPLALAAAYVWAALGLAWGWRAILELPSGVRSTLVIGVTALLVAAAVTLSSVDAPFDLVPIALAAGIVLAFLLQLIRTDGRPGLTEEIVATAGGLAFVGLGAGLVPLATLDVGPASLTVAMAGVGASLLADLVSTRLGPSSWATLLTAAVGALVGGWAGVALGLPLWWHGAVVGAVSAVLSYAVRRLIEVRPGSAGLAGQLASACGSVLAVGALAQVLARLVVAL